MSERSLVKVRPAVHAVRVNCGSVATVAWPSHCWTVSGTESQSTAEGLLHQLTCHCQCEPSAQHHGMCCSGSVGPWLATRHHRHSPPPPARKHTAISVVVIIVIIVVIIILLLALLRLLLLLGIHAECRTADDRHSCHRRISLAWRPLLLLLLLLLQARRLLLHA